MTNIISERLYGIRIGKGITVKELSNNIDIPPEKIKNFESGKEKPSVEDLIAISKFYGISIDILVANHDDGECTSEKRKNEKRKDTISFENGIHIASKNGERVDIGLGGIHIDSADDCHVNIDGSGIVVNDYEEEIHQKSPLHKKFLTFPISILCVILYLAFGFANILGGWGLGWIIFLVIPLYYSLVETIFKRKASHFAFPVLVVTAYLILGFLLKAWHPGWIIFLTIPVYYYICNLFEKN